MLSDSANYPGAERRVWRSEMEFGAVEVNDDLWNVLRKGQKNALELAFDYLNQPETRHSCLVSMPTGGGKTGVISVLAHFGQQQKILVICHRSAVREQLVKQLSGEFFTDRLPEYDIELKTVIDGVALTEDKSINVTTFQMLSSLSEVALSALVEAVDLVIVDEGHSEPSPIWSEISRSFRAHKVIITATPYRNDLFKFDVAPEWSYVYTYKHALEDNVLCEPVWESMAYERLLPRVKELLEQQPNTKCIVKCENVEAIELYAELFSPEFSVLAVHQQFSGDARENFKSTVPRSLKNSSYDVIIHQRKLDEGIDIPQAKILVLTYAVRSGRELVQTVGRVVRAHRNYDAFTLEINSNSNSSLWRNFLDFDEYISVRDNCVSFLKSLDTSMLLKRYLDAFPDVSYFDSGFRKKFDIDNFDVEQSLTIPLASLCFIKKTPAFTMAKFIDALYWKLTMAGELVVIRESLGFSIALSISFSNSRFLKDSLFFEPALQVVICRELGDLFVVYDSRGVNYSSEAEIGLGGVISLEEILSLGARTDRIRTKSATSMAIGEARRRPDGVSWRGRNLEDIHSAQSNASYALSTLMVDNLSQNGVAQSSYYLGVGSGRISDQKNRNLSLRGLAAWIDDVVDVINSGRVVESNLINSFAKPVANPPECEPASIILDFCDFSDPLMFALNGQEFNLINDIIYLEYVSGSNSFVYRTELGDVHIYLSYDINTHAPRLVLDSNYRLLNQQISDSGQEFFSGQSMTEVFTAGLQRILYINSSAFYQGRYYKFRLPLEAGFDLDKSAIGRSIIKVNELLSPGMDEKGGSAGLVQNAFLPNSVFFLIDKIRNVNDSNMRVAEYGPFFSHIPDIDYLLCTDLNTEPADFIASSETKLVFIHVKCGDTLQPRSSAGAIAEVGGQAIKNMEVLISPNKDLKFGNHRLLGAPWRLDLTHPDLLKRVRLIHKEAPDAYMARLGVGYETVVDEAWRVFTERRNSLRVEKEIWIVIGNAFSRTHFSNQVSRGNECIHESLQAFQLLDSWTATSANNDVAFKVFVS